MCHFTTTADDGNPRESINRAIKTMQSFEDPLLCTTTSVVTRGNTVEPKLVEHKRYVQKYDRSCAISQLRRRTCFIQTNKQLSRAPKLLSHIVTLSSCPIPRSKRETVLFPVISIFQTFPSYREFLLVQCIAGPQPRPLFA